MAGSQKHKMAELLKKDMIKKNKGGRWERNEQKDDETCKGYRVPRNEGLTGIGEPVRTGNGRKGCWRRGTS